jgi:hypothetical protein
MDNPGGQIIEKLDFGNNSNTEDHAPTQKTVGQTDPATNSQTLPQIVRPSSLNYKISLLEAVIAFMQKDKAPDQVLDVELEEPTSKKMQNFEVLDDALY